MRPPILATTPVPELWPRAAAAAVRHSSADGEPGEEIFLMMINFSTFACKYIIRLVKKKNVIVWIILLHNSTAFQI